MRGGDGRSSVEQLRIHQQGAGAKRCPGDGAASRAVRTSAKVTRRAGRRAPASPLPCSSAALEADQPLAVRSAAVVAGGRRPPSADSDSDWSGRARAASSVTSAPRSGNRPSSASSRGSKARSAAGRRAAPRLSACPRRRRRKPKVRVVPGEQLHQQLVQVEAREQAAPPGIGTLPPAHSAPAQVCTSPPSVSVGLERLTWMRWNAQQHGA